MRAIFASGIVLIFCSSAVAAFTSPPKAVPSISGPYTYTWIESCFKTDGGLGGIAHATAVVNFNATSGMATINGFATHGDPPVLGPLTGTAAYSNTKTTITLDGTVYEVFYGKVAKGIATSLTYIAVVDGDLGNKCSDQAQLLHQ